MSNTGSALRSWVLVLVLAVAGCGGGGESGEPTAGAALRVTRSADQAASSWNFAAWENQVFTVSGPVEVRYGVEPKWITRVVSGTVACTNVFFGSDPVMGLVKQCWITSGSPSAPLPPAWTLAASENQTFTVSGTVDVRYGIEPRWIARTVSGSVSCTNAFFGGDPAVGVAKQCWVASGTPTPVPRPASTWTFAGWENQAFTVGGAVQVRYGVEPKWITRTVSGTVACTNAFFRSDPAAGVVKQCWVPNGASVLPPSATWTFAAWENQAFLVSSTRAARYGIEPHWITRTVSGVVPCTNAFFGGDPVFGVVKHCELLADGTEPSGALPNPSLDLDFTTSLPALVRFTRDGSRKALVNGVLRELSINQPAIESWDGLPRGLAIEAASTNLLTHSNDFADGSWMKGGVAAGDTGPDGVTRMARQYERAINGGAAYFQKTVGTQVSGTRQTFSAFVRLPAGSTRWAVRLRMANQGDSLGPRAYLRIDGTPGAYTLDNRSATQVTAGLRRLANGIFHVWITGTWVVTGAKEFEVRLLNQDHGPVDGIYVGDPAEGMEIWGAQVTTTPHPVGYVNTAGTTVSSSGEMATIADLSWFNPSRGTIVIEHDCSSGTLLGSGAKTVLRAGHAGRTAIAWDSAGSTVVENGGAGTNGATPEFGPDFKLLPSNYGHIKRLTVYPARADVGTLRQLTTLPVPGTARPGALRAASVDNRLPSDAMATSGAQLNFASRLPFRLGGAPLSSLKLDFANFYFGSTSVGNAVVIDEAYLERATGTPESARVKFGGANGVTLADGAANVLSDSILPSQFTALTEFSAGMDFYVRLRGHVTTAGHKLPLSRSVGGGGAQSFVYEGGTITNMGSTGALALSGGALTHISGGVAPVLVGVYSSGDPKTLFVAGDSLIVGTRELTFTGAFVRRAAAALGIPVIEFSRIGQAQATISEIDVWKPYLRYCRIYLDDFGTNDTSRTLHFFSLWKAARDAQVDKVAHVGLLPKTTSSDSFATEANQTASRPFPAPIEEMLSSAKALGFLDMNIVPMSVRGTDPAKWLADGTALKYTFDGIHQTVAGDDLLRTELQPVLEGITVTTTGSAAELALADSRQ